MYQGDYPGITVRFENIEAEYFSGFKNMIKHFVDCIQNDRTPLFTGEKGKKVLQFVLSIYKSAKERKPVTPEETDNWIWEEFKVKSL